jgi:hypothetical protein
VAPRCTPIGGVKAQTERTVDVAKSANILKKHVEIIGIRGEG